MVKGKLARGAFCITGRSDQPELSRAPGSVIAATAAEVFHGGRPSI